MIADADVFQTQSIAVLTVSDTRVITEDKSGDTLAARIVEAGRSFAAQASVIWFLP